MAGVPAVVRYGEPFPTCAKTAHETTNSHPCFHRLPFSYTYTGLDQVACSASTLARFASESRRSKHYSEGLAKANEKEGESQS